MLFNLFRSLRWAWLWLVMASAQGGQLTPPVVSVLRDAPPTASVEDVQGQRFEPVQLPFSRPATPAVSWFRVELPPSLLDSAVLVSMPQQLDDLRLFQPHPQGGWRVSQAGDRFPYAARERPELYSSFGVRLQPDRPTVVYARLQTTSAHVLQLKLMSDREAHAWDSGLQLGMGLFLGFLGLLAMSSTVRWWISSQRLWGVGALFQWSEVVYVFAYMGGTARFVWPTEPALADRVTSVASVLAVLVAAVFYLLLMLRMRVHRVALAVQGLSVLGSVCAAGLVLYGITQQALLLNNLMLALAAPTGLLLMWFFKSRDRVLLHIIRINYVLTALLAGAYAMPFAMPVSIRDFHMYPPMPSIALIALTQFVIALRTDWLQRQEAEALAVRMQAVQRDFEQEQRQHARTAHFMSMLLHEVKNPLAAIRVAVQSLKRMTVDTPEMAARLNNIDRSVQGIDQVLERSRDLDRAEGSALSLNRQALALDGLVAGWVQGCEQPGRIRTAPLPEGGPVTVDPMMLGLMVNNLLDNALKYSPVGASVDLTVERESGPPGDRLRVEVVNPVGRAGKPDPARLFQKFYRAETAQFASGTGLGLSWISGVAQQMGGRVFYEDLGEQVAFTLELPC